MECYQNIYMAIYFGVTVCG